MLLFTQVRIFSTVLLHLRTENKAKLSQLENVNQLYCGGGVLSFQLKEFRFVLYRKSL